MDALGSSSDEETLTWNPTHRLENFSVGPRLTLKHAVLAVPALPIHYQHAHCAIIS